MERAEDALIAVAADAVLADAVDLARSAVVDDAGEAAVGLHLGMVMEADRLGTHAFECLLAGYRGWQWAVTLARAPEGEPTVCDVVLLPGADAIVAPEWLPWSDRVQPGDLGVGDVLPTGAGDPRLVPGYTGEGDLVAADADTEVVPSGWELGLGRVRVLSPFGRDEAADRWHDGDFGPDAPMAKAASATCLSCGFLLPMGGVFGQAFGVCANRMAPADGHVIALDYGCGAHSEILVDQAPVAVDLATPEESASELGHS